MHRRYFFPILRRLNYFILILKMLNYSFEINFNIEKLRFKCSTCTIESCLTFYSRIKRLLRPKVHNPMNVHVRILTWQTLRIILWLRFAPVFRDTNIPTHTLTVNVFTNIPEESIYICVQKQVVHNGTNYN